jgi:hypothetical protein
MSQGSPRLLLALLKIKLFHLYEVSGVKWIPHFGVNRFTRYHKQEINKDDKE